jgi:hAT family C-terminal dimerisation region
MALDYLPIQASAVPCERAFSSSAETDTTRRNRISPNLMEALQILKYSIRNDLIDFTTDSVAAEKDLIPLHTSQDLLAQLAQTADTDGQWEDVMDRILRDIADDEGKEDSQDD